MKEQKIFKRYELKYLLTGEEKAALDRLLAEHMVPDEHDEDLVSSIYYDTSNKLLIRRSIDKPVYKEKMRIRFYGQEMDPDHMFVELKKKYRKCVFKRRLTLSEYQNHTGSDQIRKEIDYFWGCYEDLAPSALVTYEREAWYGKEDRNFRMTFDHNIRYREYGRDIETRDYLHETGFGPVDKDLGHELLATGTYLLEVKTALGLPRWLLDFLEENKIYKTSFSKYGNGYKGKFAQTMGEEGRLAA